MYFYFKEINGCGVGICDNQNIQSDNIEWITEEEFNRIVAENEAREKEASAQEEVK